MSQQIIKWKTILSSTKEENRKVNKYHQWAFKRQNNALMITVLALPMPLMKITANGLKRSIRNLSELLNYLGKIGSKSRTISVQGLALRLAPTLKNSSVSFRTRRNLKSCWFSTSFLWKRRKRTKTMPCLIWFPNKVTIVVMNTGWMKESSKTLKRKLRRWVRSMKTKEYQGEGFGWSQRRKGSSWARLRFSSRITGRRSLVKFIRKYEFIVLKSFRKRRKSKRYFSVLKKW